MARPPRITLGDSASHVWRLFCRAFSPRFKPGVYEYPEFDATFQVRRLNENGCLLLLSLCCLAAAFSLHSCCCHDSALLVLRRGCIRAE